MESIYKPSEVQQHMNIDIFFIDGEGYLISVLTPLDHVMISRVKRKINIGSFASSSVPSPRDSRERRLPSHSYIMLRRKRVHYILF
jgi:hypothetical protein